MSTSQILEKYRIDTHLVSLLNKIGKDYSFVSESFIESMIFCAQNLSEIPYYYLKTIR